MKIGLDLDFTITEIPEFFQILSQALILTGHEIHIITYRDNEEKVKQELFSFGITYTKIHLPTKAEPVATWKAKVVTELGLDIMIDDAPEVIAALPKSTKKLWLIDPEIFDIKNYVKLLTKIPVKAHCEQYHPLLESDNPSPGEADCIGDGHHECRQCYSYDRNQIK